jgi:hypothetical protein
MKGKFILLLIFCGNIYSKQEGCRSSSQLNKNISKKGTLIKIINNRHKQNGTDFWPGKIILTDNSVFYTY